MFLLSYRYAKWENIKQTKITNIIIWENVHVCFGIIISKNSRITGFSRTPRRWQKYHSCTALNRKWHSSPIFVAYKTVLKTRLHVPVARFFRSQTEPRLADRPRDPATVRRRHGVFDAAPSSRRRWQILTATRPRIVCSGCNYNQKKWEIYPRISLPFLFATRPTRGRKKTRNANHPANADPTFRPRGILDLQRADIPFPQSGNTKGKWTALSPLVLQTKKRCKLDIKQMMHDDRKSNFTTSTLIQLSYII